MASDAEPVPSLRDQIQTLAVSHPLLATNLGNAQTNREERLAHYSSGVRLKGYEDLLRYLEVAAAAVAKTDLARVAWLLRRARGDYVVALEAMLSGLHTVAHDAMRDVMEIEFLFREFAAEPTSLPEWFECDQRTRYTRFRPALLRRRHAQRVDKRPEDLAEAADYRAHSLFVHVNPYANPFGGFGITVGGIPFAYDSCFWEMFEHARRLLLQFEALVKRIASSAAIQTIGDDDCLQEFRLAWERTQEWQSLFYSLIDSAGKAEPGEEDA